MAGTGFLRTLRVGACALALLVAGCATPESSREPKVADDYLLEDDEWPAPLEPAGSASSDPLFRSILEEGGMTAEDYAMVALHDPNAGAGEWPTFVAVWRLNGSSEAEMQKQIGHCREGKVAVLRDDDFSVSVVAWGAWSETGDKLVTALQEKTPTLQAVCVPKATTTTKAPAPRAPTAPASPTATRSDEEDLYVHARLSSDPKKAAYVEGCSLLGACLKVGGTYATSNCYRGACDPDTRYYAAVLGIMNTGKATVEVGPSSVALLTRDHGVFRPDGTPAGDNALERTRLAPGDFTAGNVLFRLPGDAVVEGWCLEGASAREGDKPLWCFLAPA